MVHARAHHMCKAMHEGSRNSISSDGRNGIDNNNQGARISFILSKCAGLPCHVAFSFIIMCTTVVPNVKAFIEVKWYVRECPSGIETLKE